MLNDANLIARKKYLIAPKSVLEGIISTINTKYGFGQGKATVTYGVPVKHPTQNKYMLTIDERFYNDFDKSIIEDYGVVELTEDWFNDEL